MYILYLYIRVWHHRFDILNFVVCTYLSSDMHRWCFFGNKLVFEKMSILSRVLKTNGIVQYE